MRPYDYIGDLVTSTDNVRPIFRCPDCGSAVDSPGAHDGFHAMVDAMFRTIEHLMDTAKRSEGREDG